MRSRVSCFLQRECTRGLRGGVTPDICVVHPCHYPQGQQSLTIRKNIKMSVPCKKLLTWNELQQEARKWVPHVSWNGDTSKKLSAVYSRKFASLSEVEKAVQQEFPSAPDNQTNTTVAGITWQQYMKRAMALNPTKYKGRGYNAAVAELAKQFQHDRSGTQLEKLEATAKDNGKATEPAGREAMKNVETPQKEADRYRYSDDDMALLGHRLGKYGVNPNRQYRNRLTYDTFPALTKLDMTHPQYIVVNPGGQQAQNGGTHWLAIVLLWDREIKRLHVLYKDSMFVSEAARTRATDAFRETFPDLNVNMLFHEGVEQTDVFSCGPMTMQNLEIVARHIQEQGVSHVIREFGSIEFCTMAECNALRTDHATSLRAEKNPERKRKAAIEDATKQRPAKQRRCESENESDNDSDNDSDSNLQKLHIPDLRTMLTQLGGKPRLLRKAALINEIRMLSQQQQSTQQSPASQLPPRAHVDVAVRIVDHGKGFLQQLKDSFITSLLRQPGLHRSHLCVQSDDQPEMSCGLIACRSAAKLKENVRSEMSVPTLLALTEYFARYTRKDWGMTEERYDAVCASLRLGKGIGLTRSEISHFASKVLQVPCHAIYRHDHTLRYGKLHPYSVHICFVAETSTSIGHFFTAAFLPHRREKDVVTSTSLKKPHPLFTQRKTDLDRITNVFGYTESGHTRCNICWQAKILLYGSSAVHGTRFFASGFAAGRAGPYTSERSEKDMRAAHYKTSDHGVAVHLLREGLSPCVLLVFCAAGILLDAFHERNFMPPQWIQTPVAEEAARVRAECDNSKVDPSLLRPLLNLHRAMFFRVAHGLSYNFNCKETELDAMQGVSYPVKYRNRHHLMDMMRHWTRLLQLRVAEGIFRSTLGVVVQLDGTTLQQLQAGDIYVVRVRYFEEVQRSRSYYLGLLRFSDTEGADGHTIWVKLRTLLGNYGVSADSVLGACVDAASNLVGKEKGVVSRLQQFDSSSILLLSDASHLFEGAMQQVLKSFSVIADLSKQFGTVETVLRNSTKLGKSFRAHCKRHHVVPLRPKRRVTIRWLPKVCRLFATATKQWCMWLAHMEAHDLLWKDCSAKQQRKRARALRTLRSRNHRTCFTQVVPLVRCLSFISLETQKETANIATIVRLMDALRVQCAHHEQDTLGLYGAVGEKLGTLIHKVKSHPVISAMVTVLDVQAIQEAAKLEAEFDTYGNEAIELLHRHFLPDMDALHLSHAWCMAKCLIVEDARWEVVFKELRRTHSQLYALLAKVYLCSCMSSNACESYFSRAKHRVGNKRGSLLIPHLHEESMVADWQELCTVQRADELDSLLTQGIGLWGSTHRRPHGKSRRTGTRKPKRRASFDELLKFEDNLTDPFWNSGDASEDEEKEEEEEEEQEEEEESDDDAAFEEEDEDSSLAA